MMGLMKGEKGDKIIAKSVATDPRLYSYCLHEKVVIKQKNDLKALIEHSNDMDIVYENIVE